MQESCVIFVLCRPGITKTGEIMYTDGIIFDVDGTLWDSTPIVAEAWTQAVLECGIKDRIVTAGELKQLFGKTMSVIAASLFPEASKKCRKPFWKNAAFMKKRHWKKINRISAIPMSGSHKTACKNI